LATLKYSTLAQHGVHFETKIKTQGGSLRSAVRYPFSQDNKRSLRGRQEFHWFRGVRGFRGLQQFVQGGSGVLEVSGGFRSSRELQEFQGASGVPGSFRSSRELQEFQGLMGEGFRSSGVTFSSGIPTGFSRFIGNHGVLSGTPPGFQRFLRDSHGCSMSFRNYHRFESLLSFTADIFV